MRQRAARSSATRTLSPARIAAWTGTLVLHTLIIGNLWRDTAVRPALIERTALTVDIALIETPPPVPPKPATGAPAAPARPQPVAVRPSGPTAMSPLPANATEPELILPDPVAPSLRLEQSRVAVAAEIARENAPRRRAFAGRSIDAMLPGADTGKLPGFRPQTVEESNGLARQIGQMLSMGVPSAAVDYHAPLDLLTEGWENRHHSSDQADCDRRYAQFESDLRHQLCGDVRPPK
ncbi:MAG: hypothetical protein AB7E72_13220 [Lysobacterales bacterium]